MIIVTQAMETVEKEKMKVKIEPEAEEPVGQFFCSIL